MLRDLLGYQHRVEALLREGSAKTDWESERIFFGVMFAHMQAERLIHLIVTMTVGIATLCACIATFIVPSVALLSVDGILIVLFFAYIVHYRKLENAAQSWYPILRELHEKRIR